MKLVVPGGNGFIGTEICRIAVENGHSVSAFGRTGRPSLSPAEHPWIQEVDWRAADVFAPDTWRDLLKDADAVVHCIAIVRPSPDRNVTFARFNYEAATLVAEEAEEANVDAFVFFSARDKPPLISNRFITTKRRAEREITDAHPGLRTVVLRPNLVYGPGRPGSATLAAILNQLRGQHEHGYTSDEGRPLPVELVAATAVQAATTETLKGTLSVSQIEDIGRTSGLVSLDEISAPSLAPLLAGVGGATLGGWLLSRLLRR